MSRNVVIRIGQISKACAGWLGIYIAAGGILAFIVNPDTYTEQPGCYPHYEMFGQIQANCPTQLINALWFIVLGLPRLAVTPLALTVALCAASAWAFHDPWYLLNALPFAVAAIPSVMLYYVSFVYWRQRLKPVAALTLLALAAETLITAFQT